MAIDGKWTITIKGPMGPMTTALDLTTVNGTLMGTQSGQGESSEITNATFDGTNISWVNHTTKPMKLRVEFAGVLDAQEMNGKVKAGFMGTFPFTGTRA